MEPTDSQVKQVGEGDGKKCKWVKGKVAEYDELQFWKFHFSAFFLEHFSQIK